MSNNEISTTIYGEIEKDLPLVTNSLKELSDDIGFEFLEKMIEQSLSGSGKMMRPALALLAGKLGNYDLEKLIPLAASVELLHTASLVHDDVIDRADARRGNETSNILFGNAAAVMLGDYMFAYAAEFITRTDNIHVVKKFAATLMMMVQGELKQDVTVFEYSEDVQRYLDRITGKTAIEILNTLINEEYISSLQHAGDMGIELCKAELALKYDLKYTQDKDLVI